MIGTKNYSIFPVTGITKEDPSTVGKQFFIKHEYIENRHRYKVKIALHESGYFVFAPQSFISIYKLSELGQHITDCEYESVNLTYFTNEGAGNFYMKQFAEDHNVNEWKDENIKKSGLYFFYLK